MSIENNTYLSSLVTAYINGTTEVFEANADIPGFWGAKFGGIKLNDVLSMRLYDYSYGPAHERYYSFVLKEFRREYDSDLKTCITAFRNMVTALWSV